MRKIKIRSFVRSWPGVIVLASCLVTLLGGITYASVAQAASTEKASGKHMVTIHDDGHDRGVLTDATTLREVLHDAKIHLDSHDKVEPGLDEPLTARNYDVNIYRARPVTVVDGSTRVKVMTAHRTPRQIMTDARLTLHDEDTAQFSRTTGMVSEGAGIVLTIDRATPFTLVLYGKSTQAYTQAATVGDMLANKGVHLAGNDTVSVPLGTLITAGMRVELWRNGKQTINREESVPFKTKRVEDPNRPVGYRKVTTPGVKGTKNVTYEVVMKNGKEISRKEIQSVVTKKPQEQVEVIGTKYDLPVGSHQDWMRAAGISERDYGFVAYIVEREGGWEPCKVQGGAIDCTYNGIYGYGMVQATPGGKMASAGADWRTNPVTQLRWATSYAVGRYGSWKDAYVFWTQNHHW